VEVFDAVVSIGGIKFRQAAHCHHLVTFSHHVRMCGCHLDVCTQGRAHSHPKCVSPERLERICEVRHDNKIENVVLLLQICGFFMITMQNSYDFVIQYGSVY